MSLDGERRALLLAFLDRLYSWSRSAGLTRVPRGDAVRLHLIDSLSILDSLGSVTSLADLGAGGGLPGIPVAIMRPRLEVALVEVRRRKCSFLAETVRELGLRNCRVAQLDARKVEAGSFDGVCARAFVAASELVEIAARIVSPGGRIVVMAGPNSTAPDDEVLARLGLAKNDERSFILPGGGERRRIIVYERGDR